MGANWSSYLRNDTKYNGVERSGVLSEITDYSVRVLVRALVLSYLHLLAVLRVAICQRDSNFFEHLVPRETQDAIRATVLSFWRREIRSKFASGRVISCEQIGLSAPLHLVLKKGA